MFFGGAWRFNTGVDVSRSHHRGKIQKNQNIKCYGANPGWTNCKPQTLWRVIDDQQALHTKAWSLHLMAHAADHWPSCTALRLKMGLRSLEGQQHKSNDIDIVQLANVFESGTLGNRNAFFCWVFMRQGHCLVSMLGWTAARWFVSASWQFGSPVAGGWVCCANNAVGCLGKIWGTWTKTFCVGWRVWWGLVVNRCERYLEAEWKLYLSKHG